MGRNLRQIIADLPSERRAGIDARYREMKGEVEGLREQAAKMPLREGARRGED